MKQFIKTITPNRIKIFVRSPIEQMIHLGYKWKSKSDNKSVLFFTVHKCASTYMNKFFRFINKKYLNLTGINMEGFLFHSTNYDITEYMQEHGGSIFRSNGFCYAPLRDYFDIDNIKDYRIIVMVRDPRDVLVSLYFSHAFSHGLPMNADRKKMMLDVRKSARDTGLNEQVLHYLPAFRDRYMNYGKHLVEGAGAALLFYENMVFDFDSWLDRIGKALDIEIDREDKNELRKMGKFGEARPENRYSHIRRVIPGDYKEKLDPDFIARINHMLVDVLDFYHYNE